MADNAENGLTWRNLNREGCELGRATKRELERCKSQVGAMEKKLDRMFWALAMSAVGLATSAILLALNLVL